MILFYLTFSGNLTLLLIMLLISASFRQPDGADLTNASFSGDANSKVSTPVHAGNKITIGRNFSSYNGTDLNCIVPLATAS